MVAASKTLAELEHNVASVNSYLGFMRHHSSYAIKRKVLTNAPPEFWTYCMVKGKFYSVRTRRKYNKRKIREDALRRKDYEHDFALSLADCSNET